MSETGVTPSPSMLASMDLPSPAERIEIARLSEIRDYCNQSKLALINVPPSGLTQPLWQQVVAIIQQDNENQHALMMALARGEMPDGPFVLESWRTGVRREAAIWPFLQEAGVLNQVAMAQGGGEIGAVTIPEFDIELLFGGRGHAHGTVPRPKQSHPGR